MNNTTENREAKVTNKFNSKEPDQRKENLLSKLKKILERSRKRIFKD